MNKYLIILFIFIIALPLKADEKVVGHMFPFKEELLSKPIALVGKCSSIIIIEWQEKHISDIGRLSEICNLSLSKFNTFIKIHNLKKQNNKPFKWNLSLLKDDFCYRCLNDIYYRFKFRAEPKEVWGYTVHDYRLTFLPTFFDTELYSNTFAHELFHALSMHYGIFYSHGKTKIERTKKDEVYANEFAKYLGL